MLLRVGNEGRGLSDCDSGEYKLERKTMRMTITEHWPADTAFDGTPIAAKDKSFTMPGDSGWKSVTEMQRELMRRFKHRNPVKIENGVRMKETFYGQSVTLYD